MKQAVSFTEGPVGRQLYIMSMPMVWGILATMSFNTVDTFFVSMLGDEPLAAMGFIFPVSMMVTSLAIGLSAGISSVIARTIGQGKAEEAKQLASDALVLALVLSLILVVLGLVFLEPLFVLLGASRELIPTIADYMVVWFLTTPLLLVFIMLSAQLRSTGHSAAAGVMMMVSALLNGLLDPLFIFGWGPVPGLGMAGAAWATLVTQLTLIGIALYWFYGRLNLAGKPHLRWAPLWQSWKAILHIGLPAMGTNMIIPFASAITVALVATYGEDAVAGFGVAMRIEPLALIAFYALSSVAGPFFGQNSHPNYHNRLHQALNGIFKFCVVFGLVVAGLLWFVSASVVALFSDSEQVRAVAVGYLMVVPFSYGLYGFVMSVAASFNGLGKPMPAMVISVARVLVLYLPLALLLRHFFGVTGLFMATAAINILMGGLGYLWLKRTLSRLYSPSV